MNWLFDGKPSSPVPESLLVYNSPVSQKYVVKMFVLNGELNHFLDENLNNMGLWYSNKEELFKFMKKCVIDFKIRRNSIPYIKRKGSKDKLYDIFRDKLPLLKDYDISLLCDIVNQSDDKDHIYYSLGIEKEKPIKKKKTSTSKKCETENISSKDFLTKNFRWMEIGK